MTRTILDLVAEREQLLRTHTDYLRVQIEQITAEAAELEAELADLAITRKVLLSLEIDQAEIPGQPALPENPACQHILAALADAGGPLRAKDLCHALDLGLEPKNIEGMRAKLKRLVARSLITEDVPGQFALHHQ
ncbi:hypothetical protein KDL01_41450 [Actinospica durhamensis]|uniref:Uncharacterized protein n=1 Tax=Actinospica durhamensis TaxID=1508375 RepID=A0A941EZS8_9ACTN|nr:hypothetical protein [Actinospica durhamensis]MBR7839782.1 hypothetical protein [Actinospica durhamensis]